MQGEECAMRTDGGTTELPGNAAERCGRIRVSLEGVPAILDMSAGMREMLGVSAEEERWLEILKGNPAVLLSAGDEARLRECVAAVRAGASRRSLRASCSGWTAARCRFGP